MRKILYSPGYGAGWSTWMYNVPKKFACEYQPIIEALERGENLMGSVTNKYDFNNQNKLKNYHPAVQQFVKECKEKFDDEPYLGGLEDLKIYECDDNVRVRIDEYDGHESVIESYDDYF